MLYAHDKCTKSQQLWGFFCILANRIQHLCTIPLIFWKGHAACYSLYFAKQDKEIVGSHVLTTVFFSMHTYIMCSISAGQRYAKCTFCRKQALQGRRSLQVSLFARLAMKSYLPIRPRKRKCLFESYGQGKPRPNAQRYFWG